MNLKYFKKFFCKRLDLFVVSFVVILFFSFFFFSFGRVEGVSMEPTFKHGDIFFVNKICYFIFGPKRGDVVQFVNVEERRLVIKRIIGLPGEKIKIQSGKMFIWEKDEWKELEQGSYLGNQKTKLALGSSLGSEFRIPSNAYFVLGDNRDQSVDSRHFGFLARDQIVGRVYGLFF